MIRQIEMENDIYKNELQELKHKNEELIKSTKEKLDDLEIQNKVKYNHLKLSMIEHLKEAKNNVTKLNMNYMDTNGQISVLQNRNLIACLENVQEQCDELKEENLKLTKKIKDLENDISIHKKTEINLVLKLKEKNLKNNINNETFQYNIKNNNISLTNNNNISENKNNSFSSPPIINKSNNNSNSFENLQKHKLIKNKKNNLKLLITNSLYSGENDISNFFLKNNKEFNYRKYNLKDVRTKCDNFPISECDSSDYSMKYIFKIDSAKDVMKERPWLTIEKNGRKTFFADTMTPAWTVLRSLIEYCFMVDRVEIFEDDSYEDLAGHRVFNFKVPEEELALINDRISKAIGTTSYEAALCDYILENINALMELF